MDARASDARRSWAAAPEDDVTLPPKAPAPAAHTVAEGGSQQKDTPCGRASSGASIARSIMMWLIAGLAAAGCVATSVTRQPRLTPISLMTALSMLALPVAAHVRLTYPPAFGPSDFLDNARTPAPCGGIAPEGTVATVLQAGEPTQVQWSLGYAHYGGPVAL